MEVQTDYETSLTLAAFRSLRQIDAAVRRLETIGVPATLIGRRPLGPGHYQLEDRTFADENGGARKGAMAGLPIGVAVGLSLALIATGPGVTALAGMAAVGAFGGAVIGGFVGTIARARFDDDSASAIDVAPEDMYVLVAHTNGGAGGQTEQARAVLKSAGAIGFLEPTLYNLDVETSRAG